MTDKIFVAMTASVAEARQAGHYESALEAVERFLTLFPDRAYLPALRMHAESCAARVESLSYQDNWDELTKLSKRALPYARQLVEHPDLGDDPLARVALERLVSRMAELRWS